MKRGIVALACASVWWLGAGNAAAQDLFELEVFEYDSAEPGRSELELHANAISGRTVPPESVAEGHSPAHISVELTHVWTRRFETALFLQTAPFGPAGSANFAGGHLRAKFRIGELPDVPLRVAVSAEYSLNRAVFDEELQTLEIRSILHYARGRLSAVVNPSLEVVIRGPDPGLEPDRKSTRLNSSH